MNDVQEGEQPEKSTILTCELIPEPDQAIITDTKKWIKAKSEFRLKDAAGLPLAAELLAAAKDKIKEIKKSLEVTVAPFKQEKRDIDAVIKNVQAPYLVVLEGLDAIAGRMNRMVLDFNRELENKRIKEQAKLDKKFEKSFEKEAKKAEAQNTPMTMPMHQVIEPVNVHKEFGIQIKKLQTYNIKGVVIEGTPLPTVDLTRANSLLREIPDEFWSLDTKALAVAHRQKGCEIKGTQHTTKEITAR